MTGRDSHDDISDYGAWPWIPGIVLAGIIIYLTFTFAQPTS